MIQKTIKSNGSMIKYAFALILVMSVQVNAMDSKSNSGDDVSLGGFAKSCFIHIASGAAAATVGCATLAATPNHGSAPAVIAGLITLAGTQVSTRALSKTSVSRREDELGVLTGIAAFLGTLLWIQKSGYFAK